MYKKLLLLFIIGLFLTGCNGNTTRNIRHLGFSISNMKFKCSYIYNNKTKVKYLLDNKIILDDGSLLDVNFNSLYSSSENCRKSNTNLKVKAIFDNKIFKDNDNILYYLTGDNSHDEYSIVKEDDSSYKLYKLLLNDNDILKIQTTSSGTGEYNILKTDGNIYQYKIAREKDDNYVITSKNIIYNKDKYNENIIDFYNNGKNTNTYIRTNNNIERMVITNKKECNKYIDVDCIFELKSDDINKYLNNITAYNGNTLITNYGVVFNNN